jgi:hypothetical protein
MDVNGNHSTGRAGAVRACEKRPARLYVSARIVICSQPGAYGTSMIRIFLCVVTVIAMALGAAAEEYRIFTSADGRMIQAKILMFNPVRKKIQLERDDGQKVWVEPGIFSGKDQDYIRGWIKASEFLQNSKLRITIDKHKKSEGKKGDNVYYTIAFDNRTDMTYRNLKIEYRFYIEGKGYERRVVKDRVVSGSLLPGQKKTMQTKMELMVEEYETYTETSYDSQGFYDPVTYKKKVRDDDARGVWFRISGPELEGKPLIRDSWFPSDLNKRVSWVEKP